MLKTDNKAFTPILRQTQDAFTLVELLISIGILAVIATAVVAVINPAQLTKQARDGNRLAEITSINQAILVYQSFGGASLGNANTIYISLPDSDPQCGSYYGQLGATTSPWNYHCSSSDNYRKMDGTGWIPVNLASVQSQAGSLFAALPIDPINTAADGLYYTYLPGGSWALSATPESEKYITSSALSDGGYSYARFESGNDLSLNMHLPNCGGLPISYAGKSYKTVQIDKQCWFVQNLDYDNGCSSKVWVNYTDVGWCGYYTGGPFADEGLLYQWSAAMNGSASAGARGLCPTGWHIPTDGEFKALIEGQATAGCESSGWQCSPAGSHLSDYTLNHDNSSGFSGILAGGRDPDGSFDGRASYARIWSSDESGDTAWVRYLYSDYASVFRNPKTKQLGLSVRCLKD